MKLNNLVGELASYLHEYGDMEVKFTDLFTDLELEPFIKMQDNILYIEMSENE